MMNFCRTPTIATVAFAMIYRPPPYYPAMVHLHHIIATSRYGSCVTHDHCPVQNLQNDLPVPPSRTKPRLPDAFYATTELEWLPPARLADNKRPPRLKNTADFYASTPASPMFHRATSKTPSTFASPRHHSPGLEENCPTVSTDTPPHSLKIFIFFRPGA